jgi:hypothetical protein
VWYDVTDYNNEGRVTLSCGIYGLPDDLRERGFNSPGEKEAIEKVRQDIEQLSPYLTGVDYFRSPNGYREWVATCTELPEVYKL